MSHSSPEQTCMQASLPTAIGATLAAYAWERNKVGQSGASLHRLHGRSDAPDLFLKHGTGAIADHMTDEMTRLRWLGQFVPVPSVVHFVRTPDQAWLLTSALKGKTAGELLASRPELGPAIVDALAAFLRRLHAIPVEACPFNSDHTVKLRLARQRIDAGAVDVDDFDDERAGWTAEQVWASLQDHLPLAPDLVVTHGDYSLDNLLMHDGEVVGCIDVGGAGLADRYQDLAIAWNNLGDYGEALPDRLFLQYGLPFPDRRKLRFHLLLDELF
ncbi:APH(3')-I family aminoglycoside O-phosphotransferase [Massilia atriviolacea]|uniref:Aminoglycoside 3'-phosphotransferase n=1 Tax=Massilia atriviolacea TaxID=2495579 RepID=A0A430HFD6_9BURK|nr:APH(3')-I family aminoglycoside O-phosphotransferase [Massilia atriviolacea]RSZ56225.1 APH(3')-I family aminoglycoside O-phosphotransferase [Massilia atriviolacea]